MQVWHFEEAVAVHGVMHHSNMRVPGTSACPLPWNAWQAW